LQVCRTVLWLVAVASLNAVNADNHVPGECACTGVARGVRAAPGGTC